MAFTLSKFPYERQMKYSRTPHNPYPKNPCFLHCPTFLHPKLVYSEKPRGILYNVWIFEYWRVQVCSHKVPKEGMGYERFYCSFVSMLGQWTTRNIHIWDEIPMLISGQNLWIPTGFVYNVVLAAETNDTNTWFVNSGASIHMTCNRSWYDNFKEVCNGANIYLGDDHPHQIK